MLINTFKRISRSPGCDSAANPSTRPVHLPPKSPDEEAKHRQEYQEILVRQKTKSEERATEEVKKEENMARLRMEWRKLHTSVTWDAVSLRRTPRAEALIWRSVPANWREVVWEVLIGNSLNIDDHALSLYTLEKHLADPEMESTVRMQIMVDLPRTFPALKVFCSDGPMNAEMLQLLQAFARYKPDLGYVQGMSYVAGMLLLNMGKIHAFRCLVHVLCHPFFKSMYRMDPNALEQCFGIFSSITSARSPQLARHLSNIGITYDSFSLEWFLTIFSRSFHIDLAVVLWDLFMFYSTPVLFRAAYAILKLFEPQLLAADFEGCYRILSKPKVDWQPATLLKHVSQVHLKRAEITAIRAIGRRVQ